jgi:hypothetical protein
MGGDQSRKICADVNDPDRPYYRRTPIWTGQRTIDFWVEARAEKRRLANAFRVIKRREIRLDQTSIRAKANSGEPQV